MPYTQMFGNEEFQSDLDENGWTASGSELDNVTNATYPLYLPTPQQPHGLSLDDDGLSSLGDNWDQGIIYPTPNPPHPDFLLLSSLDEPNGQDGVVATGTGDAGAYNYVTEQPQNPLDFLGNGFELTGTGDFNGYNDNNWTLDNNGSFFLTPQDNGPSIWAADALPAGFNECASALATTVTRQVEQDDFNGYHDSNWTLNNNEPFFLAPQDNGPSIWAADALPAAFDECTSPLATTVTRQVEQPASLSADAGEARTGDLHPKDGLTVITTINDANAWDAPSRPGPSSDESPVTDSPRSPVISTFSPSPPTPDTAATTPSPVVALKDLEVPRSAAPTSEPTQVAEVSQSAKPTPKCIPAAPVAMAASSRNSQTPSVLPAGFLGAGLTAATAPPYGGESSDRPMKRPRLADSSDIETSTEQEATTSAGQPATATMPPSKDMDEILAEIAKKHSRGLDALKAHRTGEAQKEIARLTTLRPAPATQVYTGTTAVYPPRGNNFPVASNMRMDAASTSQVQQCGSTTRRRYAPRVKPTASKGTGHNDASSSDSSTSASANAAPSCSFTFTSAPKSSAD